MKKKWLNTRGHHSPLLKWLRIMKLTLLILTITFVHVSASIYAQQTRLSISANNVSVKEVLRDIEDQSEFFFLYKNDEIDVTRKVSINTKDKSLQEILNLVFKGTEVTYEIYERQIVLKSNSHQDRKEHSVSGKLTDSTGQPLPGVSVVIKGTTNGTITDFNGDYFLQNIPADAILTFSFVGMKSQEIAISGKQVINVIMDEETIGIEEVVAVGYGTAKKRDLVGTVEHISGDLMAEHPNMNVARSLQGMVPGLNITLSDGKPSRGARDINIRGTESIGAGGSPLILIDGVDAHGDLTTINPTDIESISVLKDASSAAIYGARGAFGVVLITTKNPQKGSIQVNYHGNISIKERMYKVEDNIVTNGLEWTNSWYEGYVGCKGTPPAGINNAFPYTTDWYNELVKRDADPTLAKIRVNNSGYYEYFGNTNWLDIIYKDFNQSTEHNISMSGGSDVAKFYISGRYFSQNSIYTAGNEDYNQYNLRAKGSIKLSEKLTIDNNFDIIRRSIHQPKVNFNELLLRQMEHQGYPVTLPKNPDGTWSEAGVYTGWASFDEGTTYQKNRKFDFKNTTTLIYKPVKELVFTGDFSYYYNQSEQVRVEDMYDFYVGPGIKKSREKFTSLDNWSYNNEYKSANATVNYVPKFSNEDHKLNALVGWNIEEKRTTNIETYRRGLIYPELPSFALMDGDYYTLNQTGSEWSYMGFLYRANYIYKNRYLAEFSGRYDGSSKFPKNQQWGFFPSASIGWRLSEEGFMASTRNWLNNMKIRVSAGSLGNGLVDSYMYQSLMYMYRTTDVIDGSLQSYTEAPRNIPTGLTWETNTTYNVGLDLDMFSNRLSFGVDVFKRYTTDMFTIGPAVPAVFGDDVPKGNNAKMKTDGIDLSLQWKSSFSLGGSAFNYNIKGIFWDNKSVITKYNNPTNLLSTYYEGQVLGEIWGYKIEGIFKDQADIDSHANQSKIRVSDSNVLLPGDLKYADLDNSGVIDNGNNTLDDHGDMKIIGNTHPRYNYGLNLSANWKGFGISAFIQGIGKKNWYPNPESGFFWGHYNRPYGFMLKEQQGDNRWTEENQNTEAYWPRLRSYLALNAGKSLSTKNDRYLQNVGYTRLKTLRLDYTFSEHICKNIGLSNLQIYLEGDNLFTLSPLFKHCDNLDPEAVYPGDSDFGAADAGVDGDGYGYPMLRSYTIGLNIKF